MNTFNKVWIVPGSADVVEHETMAIITDAKLNVMLDQDYSALNKSNAAVSKDKVTSDQIAKVNAITEDVVRAKILPMIEKEVNTGKNFAQIRQMYHALVLSTWFRQKMLNSFYKHYMNQSKAQGIQTSETEAKAKIYKLYNEAFKKGVYDFMAKEKDLGTGKTISRHYFSGGAVISSSLTNDSLLVSSGKEKIKEFLKKVTNTFLVYVTLSERFVPTPGKGGVQKSLVSPMKGWGDSRAHSEIEQEKWAATVTESLTELTPSVDALSRAEAVMGSDVGWSKESIKDLSSGGISGSAVTAVDINDLFMSHSQTISELLISMKEKKAVGQSVQAIESFDALLKRSSAMVQAGQLPTEDEIIYSINATARNIIVNSRVTGSDGMAMKDRDGKRITVYN